jgi:hypothetical protein
MYLLKPVFFMYQADFWSDLKDEAGNILHIGKLEYKIKQGKKPNSFRAHVFPRDINRNTTIRVWVGTIKLMLVLFE